MEPYTSAMSSRPAVLLLLWLGVGCQPEPGASPQEPPTTAGEAPSSGVTGEQPAPWVLPPASAASPADTGVCSEARAPARSGRPSGVIVVESDGPAEDAQVLRRAHGRLVRCYAPLLRERPGLAGALAFALRVGPDGRVLAADLTPESDLPGALARCLSRALEGLRFAPGERRVEGRLRLSP